MAVQTSAGVDFALSLSQPATEDDSGYSALTYTSVGEVESIDEYGIEFETTEFTSLKDRKVRKYKGSYNPGETSLTLGRDPTDEGQALGRQALMMDEDVSFKVTYQDGAVDYFMGKVTSYTTDIQDADSITMSSMNIAINSDTVSVPAPASP